MFAVPLLALLLRAHPVLADTPPPGQPAAITATVQVAGIAFKPGDLYATQKPGYIHLLADLFPYREALKASGGDAKLGELAKGLVAQAILPRFPKARSFKVVLAEFLERDNYDAPRWDKIRILGRFEFTGDARSLTLTPKAKD